MYPPFLGTDMNKVGMQDFFEDADWAEGLRRTVSGANELARSIRLESKGDIWAAEYFQSWLTNQDLDREPDLIEQILPLSLRGRVLLEPVLDDRMYVVCWYGNDRLSRQVSGGDPPNNYKTHDWWYSYMFVDREWKTCENKEMMQELLTSATYARWANYGTFYGISRYSFMALMGEMEKQYISKLLFTHTQTLYYKLALLCLVQRACLLRFSDEITAISQLDKSERQIGERVGSLYKQYLRFVNKIYFREVTAQEQGIELYEIMQQQMRLPQQVRALQEEMKELHQYAMIVEEDHRNDKLDILTYIGAFFVVPSFIGTYFGISDYDLSGQWIWISVFCLLSAGLAFAAIRATGDRRMVCLGLLIALMVIVLFIFPNIEKIWE
ncbi:MAG TPA: hypothetical protein PKB07_05530 [Flavilitoribacter sp.]|nr:hypothetical protein [Flavilitoribacter sp.]